MFLQDLKLDNNLGRQVSKIYLGDQYMIGDKKVEFKNYQLSSFTDENFILDFTTPINEDGRKCLPKVSFNNILFRSFDNDAIKWLKFMYLSFSIVRKSDFKRFRVSVKYEDKELRDFLTNETFAKIDKELTISDKDIGIQDKSWLQDQHTRIFNFDSYWLSPINTDWMFDKLEMLSFLFEDNTPRPVLTQFKQWIDFNGWVKLYAPCVATSNS